MMIGDARASGRSLRCLRARTLVRLAEEGGTAQQQRHLAGCPHCAARHTAIIRARDTAALVLRDAMWQSSPAPLAARAGRTPRPARAPGRAGIVRWAAPIAMAAGLVLALLAGSRRTVELGGRQIAGSDVASSAALSLDDLAHSVFTIDDAAVWLEADADESRWEAALLGERPCETDAGFGDPQCD